MTIERLSVGAIDDRTRMALAEEHFDWTTYPKNSFTEATE